jgi:hypothetical protein
VVTPEFRELEPVAVGQRAIDRLQVAAIGRVALDGITAEVSLRVEQEFQDFDLHGRLLAAVIGNAIENAAEI